MFEIKDGYKLELKTPETINREKLIEKTNNREDVPLLEVTEVILVQWNLVHNQYQQKSEGLSTFSCNISYAYLVNFEPNNLVFLKTYNTEFENIYNHHIYWSKW